MNNFCAYPWVGLDISPQGEMKPCCWYESTVSNNINEYYTSSHLHELKNQFLRNEKPSGCKRCWDQENAGKKSKRLMDLEYIFHNKNPDLSHIKTLSIAFGNTCNLACRTCSSYSSSKWVSDERKLSHTLQNIKIHNHTKFYKDKQFTSMIHSLSNNLTNITFPGGESFITGIQEQLDYLDHLRRDVNASAITLNYITNCTVFPHEVFWEKWESFKRVNINLSIDGTGDKFEYLRYPAKWDQVYNNIKKYQNKISNLNNITLSINHTVSILNILDVKDFLLWCIREKLPLPYFNILSDPMYFNIQTLPYKIKETLKTKLSGKHFEDVIQYMLNDNSKSDLNLALVWLNSVDSIRNQKFTEVFPELADLLVANKY